MRDLVNSQLQDYACESKMISDKQFACKNFSSCNVDEWKWAIDNKKLTVAAFLDLRKAFQVMNHRILLNKLKNAGITGTAIQWFVSYLTDRKQYVCCNGYSSDVLSVKEGVPQGSVLGPTLFSIYYDSVHSVITNSSCKLFADDTEIHSSVSDIGSAVDNVNEDLVSIEKWLKENEMVTHPKKSEVMKIGSRPALMNTGDVVIKLNNQILKEVSTYKYFGVLLDNQLIWKDHLLYICKRIYPKLSLLNRLSSFLPRYVLLNIYKQTILPILDYGCIVWLDCVVKGCLKNLKGFKSSNENNTQSGQKSLLARHA